MSFLNPAPQTSPDSQPFWDAANRRELLLRHCEGCDRAHWYPRPFCPFCGGPAVWRAVSGKGRIYAHCFLRRVPAPYVLAYVTLDEGPTVMTNIIDCDPEALRIGQAVTVRFVPSEDPLQLVPLFTPG